MGEWSLGLIFKCFSNTSNKELDRNGGGSYLLSILSKALLRVSYAFRGLFKGARRCLAYPPINRAVFKVV